MTLTQRAGRGGVVRLATTAMTAMMLVLGLVIGGAGTAMAAPGPPAPHGPDPTEATFTNATGPFAFARTTVSRGNGFGGGTVYYPTATDQGTFGAIAIAPGFTQRQSAVSWFGPRLASQGFVVFTIDTNSPYDQPSPRGTQLLAALDYLTTRSTVADRIDPGRLAVMGHSMGGGGTLDATITRPGLKAAVPTAPYENRKNFSASTVPTLIIGSQNDTTAPVAQHAKPFYTSMQNNPRAYLELAGASHRTPNSPSDVIAKYTISWMKRFVDDDVRYDRFLCPIPQPGQGISAYQGTCPLG